MKLINEQLLNETAALAKLSPRLRMNHNFHEDLNDPVNRLINAMQPGTYLRPHRHLHPPKEEIFLILRGKIILFIFDDAGNVTEKLILSPEEGNYGAELSPGVWHGLIVLESDTVLYEIKQGPFCPLAPEDFAPWSPAPENKEEVKEYLNRLSSLY